MNRLFIALQHSNKMEDAKGFGKVFFYFRIASNVKMGAGKKLVWPNVIAARNRASRVPLAASMRENSADVIASHH